MMKKIVWLTTALAIATLMVIGACSSKNPNFNAARTHHTAEGFRNLYADKHPGGFWKWKREQWSQGLPKKPQEGYRFSQLKPDIAFLAANRNAPTVTWIGHATLLVQLSGLNILTDPHFSERASPVDFAGPKRVVPAALTIDELPSIDIVVISHNHYDHLDAASVMALNKRANGKTRFLVPLGVKKWFTARKIDNVVEMDWWDEHSEPGATFAFTPMQHWSKRTLLDTNQALWGGWFIRTNALKFIFIADSGYSKDFTDIYNRYGAMDFAAVPIGHYEPRWFMKMQHANPPEALQMVQDLHATKAIGVHWGTFDDLTDESLYDPPKMLTAALAAAKLPSDKLSVMTHGETREIR